MAGKRQVIALVMGMAMGTGATAAGAQDSRLSVGAGVSTLGFTVEPAFRINDGFGVRAPIGYAGISRTTTLDDIDFAGDIGLGGVALLGDVFLPDSRWRISGGVFASNIKLDGRAESAALELGDGTFAASVDVRVRARSSLSPMIAIGRAAHTDSGWSLSSDIGLIFTPLRATLSGAEVGGNTAGFETELQSAQDEINRELNRLKVFPYVSVQAVYRF
jgi:hypothetical protein